jgi:hypothetical protein
MGDTSTSFEMIVGDKSVLYTFNYIITLDADTDLVHSSAVQFIGTMAHPLNRPVLDKNNNLKDGYAIIQSEVRNHIISSGGSVFSRIFIRMFLSKVHLWVKVSMTLRLCTGYFIILCLRTEY